MPRRRPKQQEAEVRLNLAAMLDMAFQLLTFFILTFKPAPIEGQLALRLPPPQPIESRGGARDGRGLRPSSPTLRLETLAISVLATESGAIDSLAIGEGRVANLRQLDVRLQAAFTDPASTFDQVIVQASAALRYEHLMQVVEICSRQTLADGRPLAKLSFVELP